MSKYVAKKITIVSIAFVIIISIFSLLSFSKYILKLEIDASQKHNKWDTEEGTIENEFPEGNSDYLYSKMENDNIEKLYLSDLVGQLSLTDQIAVISITDKLQDEDKNEILDLALDGLTQDD